MRLHKESAGQSLIEFALTLPVLLVLVFGVTDFARAFYFSIEVSGAARAGVREAIISEDTDIGDAVRSEPNNAIPNTVAVWGDTGPAQANASCASAAGSQSCGDPGGCQASAFTGSRVACFAIRSCTLSATDLGTCTAYGSWGSRPISSAAGTRAIQVLVVYRFTPQTPLSSQVLPLTGGFFRLQQSAIGSQLYF